VFSRVLSSALLGVAALTTGCSTQPVTTLEVSWVTPQLPQTPFKKLLIITVASEEFVQIAFQDQMAAQLNKRGLNAVASGRYFTRYTDAERARFMQSIAESNADFVLLARVTNTEVGTLENRGTVVGLNGLPYADAYGVEGAYARAFTGGAREGGDHSVKTVTAETSIYAVEGRKLIWSARTKSTNAHRKTGEESAALYIPVILEAMKKDKLF
jgi:hypothetical protein